MSGNGQRAIELGDRFALRAIEVLKEYIPKLKEWRKEHRELREKWQRDLNVKQDDQIEVSRGHYLTSITSFHKLERQLQLLASSCSQHMEHGAGSDEILLELGIRLAEFERELTITAGEINP